MHSYEVIVYWSTEGRCLIFGRPDRYRTGLSPEVAAAVPEAAHRILSLPGD